MKLYLIIVEHDKIEIKINIKKKQQQLDLLQFLTILHTYMQLIKLVKIYNNIIKKCFIHQHICCDKL